MNENIITQTLSELSTSLANEVAGTPAPTTINISPPTFKLESTSAIEELLTPEEANAFAQLSIKEIQEGRPILDGSEDVGATHSYIHAPSGTKIETYTAYDPGSEPEWTVFIGLNEEIQALMAESEAFQQRPQPIVNETPKIGRNDPCPCGSTKKYKKCCL